MFLYFPSSSFRYSIASYPFSHVLTPIYSFSLAFIPLILRTYTLPPGTWTSSSNSDPYFSCTICARLAQKVPSLSCGPPLSILTSYAVIKSILRFSANTLALSLMVSFLDIDAISLHNRFSASSNNLSLIITSLKCHLSSSHGSTHFSSTFPIITLIHESLWHPFICLTFNCSVCPFTLA